MGTLSRQPSLTHQQLSAASLAQLMPLPGVTPNQAMKGPIDKMLVMGASMDGKLLKEAAEVHHKALGSMDAKLVTSAADYAAINAAIGKTVASVPRSDVMDVYNSVAKIL